MASTTDSNLCLFGEIIFEGSNSSARLSHEKLGVTSFVERWQRVLTGVRVGMIVSRAFLEEVRGDFTPQLLPTEYRCVALGLANVIRDDMTRQKLLPPAPDSLLFAGILDFELIATRLPNSKGNRRVWEKDRWRDRTPTQIIDLPLNAIFMTTAIRGATDLIRERSLLPALIDLPRITPNLKALDALVGNHGRIFNVRDFHVHPQHF